MRDQDKFRGCIIGGAAGDALGYAVEFAFYDYICRKFGAKGITEYDLVGGEAIISDDTQMVLFTAAGLLNGGDIEAIRKSYLDWYTTQTKSFPNDGNAGFSGLLGEKRLFFRRAPGNTCLSALHSGGNGSVAVPINNSKGCGGVMRTAPIGLFFCGKDVSLRDVDMLGAEAAALTHGHELGYIPSAALVHIIYRLVSDPECTLLAAVENSISAMQALFPDSKHIRYFTALMERAVDLASADMADVDAIGQLGEGWVAEETLAIAVYCALKYPDDFDRAMIAAVNHDGDSDSTGAVAGNILGTYIGYSAIPEKYKVNLELSDLMLTIADEMCRK